MTYCSWPEKAVGTTFNLFPRLLAASGPGDSGRFRTEALADLRLGKCSHLAAVADFLVASRQKWGYCEIELYQLPAAWTVDEALVDDENSSPTNSQAVHAFGTKLWYETVSCC